MEEEEQDGMTMGIDESLLDTKKKQAQKLNEVDTHLDVIALECVIALISRQIVPNPEVDEELCALSNLCVMRHRPSNKIILGKQEIARSECMQSFHNICMGLFCSESVLSAQIGKDWKCISCLNNRWAPKHMRHAMTLELKRLWVATENGEARVNELMVERQKEDSLYRKIGVEVKKLERTFRESGADVRSW